MPDTPFLRDQLLRAAPFALRVVQRRGGRAAILYRRQADPAGRDRLQRVAALSPLAYSAGQSLLQEGLRDSAASLQPSASPTPAQATTSNPSGLSPSGRSLKPQTPNPQPATRSSALAPGLFLPLDATWGARLACFALLAAGLRDGVRLLRAAERVRQSDPAQAAWWLGLLLRDESGRTLRAFRILTEAVQ